MRPASSADRILFVMNRFDKRIAITPERVGESLRQEIVVVIPFDDRIVSYSVNRGVPFMLDNNKSQPVGKSIVQLADLVRERIAKLEQASYRKRLTDHLWLTRK